jgi:hypothetical protein
MKSLLCASLFLCGSLLLAQENPAASTPPIFKAAAQANLGGTYGTVIVDGDACCTGNAGVLLRASSTKPFVVAQTGASDTSSGFVVFNAANAELFRVRSDGVIILGGVTPSPWHSIVKQSIEYLNTSISFGQFTDVHITSNAYYDGGANGGWKYRTSGVAANYFLIDGTHRWRVGPSGTVNGELIWKEAMRLVNSGNLGIGETLPSARLHVKGALDGLRVVTQNSNGFGFEVADAFGNTGPIGGVIASVTGNSVVRVSNLQLGDGTTAVLPEVKSTVVGQPCT